MEKLWTTSLRSGHFSSPELKGHPVMGKPLSYRVRDSGGAWLCTPTLAATPNTHTNHTAQSQHKPRPRRQP